MSQENRATHPLKGPVARTFSAIEGGVALQVSCLLEGVAVHGGVAATLSPGSLQ